jgi:DNA-3-methyladenine glycosylase
MTPALPHSFYLQDAVTVAKSLLGCTLTQQTPEGTASGIIVETEAYLHEDPASHAFKGQTPRNASMFKEGGIAYTYVSYGMHICFNAVTGPEGVAEAVLVRALQPVEGIALMENRRKTTILKNLCSGPGKLAQALAIGKAENGLSLLFPPLFISGNPSVRKEKQEEEIVTTKRIGISQASEMPLRFYLKGNTFISKP